jgi:tetratricopeptide (TPR) repeat protein
MSGEEQSGKVSWLWSQVEDARKSRDTERAREGLERLLASQEIRGTPDQDLALLYLSQLEMEEGAGCRKPPDGCRTSSGTGFPVLRRCCWRRTSLHETGLVRQLMEALESYLQHYPQDTDALRKKGLLLLMQNRDAEAERTLTSVARREKFRVPSTLSYLAMLEAKRGNLEESLHLLLQARGLAPSTSG